MYIIANSNIATYDIGTDSLVANINNFLEDVILESIKPQKIVVDESCQDVIDVLSDNGFEVIMLHSYLKYKTKTEPTLDSNSSDEVSAKSVNDEKNINTIDTSNNEEVTIDLAASKPQKKREFQATNKKTGFFSKLFKSNKKENPVEVQLDQSLINIASSFEVKDIRGARVKNLCLSQNILTQEQIHKVEELMDNSYKFGIKKRFIQCARDAKLLSEDAAADVLSKVVNKEVISKNKCNVAKLLPFNIDVLDLLSDFFIYKVDNEKKEIIICKDCSITPETYLLEKKYMNYKIIMLNVIEGVTKEVIKELKAGARSG